MPFNSTDKNQQIRDAGDICTIIGKLSLGDSWIIPAQQEGEGDGCMGPLCVSRFQKVLVTQDTKWLALHVTFEIPHLFIPTSAKLLQRTAIDITLKNLHLTARPIDSQKKISEIGAASILDSQVSMHRGVNNGWTYNKWDEEKLQGLAAALGIAYVNQATMLGTLNGVLQDYQAIPLPSLSKIGKNIVSAVQDQIAENVVNPLGGAVIVAVKTENW